MLGATGSIGDSTMDLLRASKDRYRVEALTANSNVEGLAKLAKEFGATDPGKIRSDIGVFLEQLQKKRIVDY